MKTKWILLGFSMLSIFSLTAFNTSSNSIYSQEKGQSNEVTAAINKNTTEKELEDLKGFFSKNGIELLIKKLEFNDQNEITSLSLVLKKGNSKSNYAAASNEPIEDLELGYKNDSLFISNADMPDIASWKNQSNFLPPSFDMDSIMKNYGFSFDFGKNGDSLFVNGNHIDIHKLKDQLMSSFNFDEDWLEGFSMNSQSLPFGGLSKFNFKDDPNLKKLIIIDGKESDFKTLDKKAKSDQLEVVDFLKPETAISVYGDKAKDGAIIATSKK